MIRAWARRPTWTAACAVGISAARTAGREPARPSGTAAQTRVRFARCAHALRPCARGRLRFARPIRGQLGARARSRARTPGRERAADRASRGITACRHGPGGPWLGVTRSAGHAPARSNHDPSWRDTERSVHPRRDGGLGRRPRSCRCLQRSTACVRAIGPVAMATRTRKSPAGSNVDPTSTVVQVYAGRGVCERCVGRRR